MPILDTHCRCGVELLVRHGGVIHCSHCDSPCLAPGRCAFCALLSVTCADCYQVHPDTVARSKCEALRR